MFPAAEHYPKMTCWNLSPTIKHKLVWKLVILQCITEHLESVVVLHPAKDQLPVSVAEPLLLPFVFALRNYWVQNCFILQVSLTTKLPAFKILGNLVHDKISVVAAVLLVPFQLFILAAAWKQDSFKTSNWQQSHQQLNLNDKSVCDLTHQWSFMIVQNTRYTSLVSNLNRQTLEMCPSNRDVQNLVLKYF